MNNSKKYSFDRFKSKNFNWRSLLLISLLILSILAVLKLINVFPNKFYSNKRNNANGNFVNRNPGFPSLPGKLIPIDTNQIITIPDDPLERKILGNLLNVYLHKNVDIQQFASSIVTKYVADSVRVTYFAEEYKRVQFSVPVTKRDVFKIEWARDTSKVKFICYESVIRNSQKEYNDPGFRAEETMWFYERIGLFDAWKTTKGKNDIIIAVIDDSFDPGHFELIHQIVNPWNVFAYSNQIETYSGKLKHGTHVAGTAVGELNNSSGIAGVAPNCKLMPIQIADQNGMMTTTSILDGIFYALKNGAKVINLSLGLELSSVSSKLDETQQNQLISNLYSDEAKMWNEVYEIACKEGAVIVQAAGNSNVLAGIDPMKRSDLCIVVGASDRNNIKAEFSNYGANVDIYAPGVKIFSSVPNNKFDYLNGTSMATPIIAGCVALIKSVDKGIDIQELKKLLSENGWELQNSNGKVVNINKALNKLNNYARN